MSTALPPPVTIDGTDTLRAYSELSQQALTRYADDLANQASRLHAEIEYLLKSEGLDQASGLFSTGSTANATATGFVKLAKRAADLAEATAKVQRALDAYWLKNIKGPVEAARAARTRGSRPKLTV